MKNSTTLYMRTDLRKQISVNGPGNLSVWFGTFGYIGEGMAYAFGPINRVGGNSSSFVSSIIGYDHIPVISGIPSYNERLLSYALSEIGYGEGVGDVG